MVEWKKLGEISKRNKGIPITASQMLELNKIDGKVRIFAAGHTFADVCESDLPFRGIYSGPSVIVKSRGYIDFDFYEKPFTHKSEMWSYTFNDKLLGRYIYYYLLVKTIFFRKKAKANSVKLPQLCVSDTDEYKIPIPPLSEQQRIVDILDTFTNSIENLKKQISHRRKQYEYYRDHLLNLQGKEGVEMKTLGDEIIFLKTGLNPRKNFVLNAPNSNIPYITGKEIFNNSINVTDKTDRITKEALNLINKRACLENNLILFASTGTGTVGRMAVVDEYNGDWGMSETLYSIKMRSGYIPKYIMYCLYSDSVKKQYEPKISKGSVPHLKVVDLLNVKIPVLPLSEQERIVSILDQFEASIENLEKQLQEREKQYEYYRDSLLRF